MESSPQASVTDNFNPFAPSSVDSRLGVTSLIYEPMLQFDTAKATQAPYDFLATRYSWGPEGRSITFTVRSNVKFSDGSVMTPADVAFTYNLLKQYPDVNTTGLPITNVAVSGQDVTISFSSSQYTNLQNVASVYIVPRSIWSSVGDPGKYIVTDPIGTGPYVLDNDAFAPQGFALQANSSYWGGPWAVGKGAPKVSSIEFPALTSNSTVLSQLVSNQLDWAGNLISDLGPFVNGHPNHKVWFVPLDTVSLYPNLTVWPTNQLAVREAISLALDRSTLSAQGESGFEPPATNASGLTLPNFSALITPSVANMTLGQNLEQARAVLEAAGYKQNSAGWFEKSGEVVSLSITDPTVYSDYAADDAIVATELRAAGIDATFTGQSLSVWGADLADGSYQLSMRWGQTSLSAYQLYDYWLNSSLYTSSPKSVSGDFERLDSPAIDADLARLESAATLSAQKTDIAPIEKYVATQLPVIPTLYGAAFDEYDTSGFTGWPSATNPYESGSPSTPTNEVVVLHLSPTS
jgi:peptide/nickel transport system substrate-binding protein